MSSSMVRHVVAAVSIGLFPLVGAAGAQDLVKVTPLGSHAGELCARDRALLFEDPTGVRILYDPGQTTDETDPRLGDVHVILLSHAHVDHIGGSRPNPGAGSCAAPLVGAANPNSNLATIAAAKNSVVFVTSEMNAFITSKIQGARGTAPSACGTGGLDNETIVPNSSACTAQFGPGASRTIRRGGGSSAVRIIGTQAIHPSGIPAALLDAPVPPSGTVGYGSVAMGFIVLFTNGLRAYLTGDTGVFGDMGQVISRFYSPNLMVINIGPGGNGPTSLGPEEAALVVQHLVRPVTVMPSHVGEQATSGGRIRGNTWTDRFATLARPFTDIVLPISDVVLTFDGEGRCLRCPR
jgi:L-ascorbate metabolism protein UlaG (beta-lactamase superfamily)